jgi:hypothetical protein
MVDTLEEILMDIDEPKVSDIRKKSKKKDKKKDRDRERA